MISFFLLATLALATVGAHTTGRAKLSHRHDVKIGSRAPAETIHECVISVKLNHMKELGQHITDIAMPRSGKYGKHLSRSELGEMIGNPTATAAVEKYLETHGVKVVKKTAYGELLTVQAPISTWENLLRTKFYTLDRTNYSGKWMKPIYRAMEYSLPDELVNYVSTILRTVQIPPRVRSYGIRYSKGDREEKVAIMSHHASPKAVKSLSKDSMNIEFKKDIFWVYFVFFI